MKTNKIGACPGSPNCVSSLAEDTGHKIEPLSFACPGQEAFIRLKKAIESLPNSRLVSEERDYMHFEFRTRFLRFVDDVEVQLNDGEKRIEIRSASRVGYYDFGANKTRVELIRRRFNNQ